MIPVRIANIPRDMLNSVTQKERIYYRRQALKIATILNHEIMQSLLREVIEFENIGIDRISDIRVMVLPSTKDWEYGDHLLGLYDTETCQVSIYPAVKYKGSRFLYDPMVSFQFVRESFNTLIHEILHAKYPEESTVKRLTQKYLNRFHKMLRDYLE